MFTNNVNTDNKNKINTLSAFKRPTSQKLFNAVGN